MNTFQRHVTEMVLSMLIPMGVLAVSFNFALPSLGFDLHPGMSSPASLASLVIALLGMTVPMVILMRVRGHAWWQVWEMTAAMFVPLVMVIPVVRFLFSLAGLDMTPSFMLPIAFVAMTGGMLVPMLMRRDVYSGHGHHHGQDSLAKRQVPGDQVTR